MEKRKVMKPRMKTSEFNSETDEDQFYQKPKPKKKGKVDVISLVLGTADRINLNRRKIILMAASTCSALDCPLETTNNSRISA